MGIKKWLIKYGPGSIGDSARTIFKVYKSVKLSFSELDEEKCFLMTLRIRREHIKSSKPEFIIYDTYEQIEKDVKTAQGDLVELIFQELHKEYPILNEIYINDHKLYVETRKIVEEIVNKNKTD